MKIQVGISRRKHGSIKKNKKIIVENLKKFADEFGLDQKFIVLMHQVHSDTARFVSDAKNSYIEATDALVTNKPNVFLGVTTADCVPVLLFDEKSGVISAIHAGYRGILSGIIENTLDLFVKKGGKLENTQVIIGPSIGGCCYNVDKDRAFIFQKKYGSEFLIRKDNDVFVNLPDISKYILKHNGIPEKNIFVSDICTKDNTKDYYSYRGDSKETFGEFVSIIGMVE